MAALSNYAENKLVDLLFRGQAFTPPGTLHIALYTAAPNDAGGGTECSGTGYARTAVAASLVNFAGTQSAGSTSASSGSSGTTSNNASVAFATPGAGGWGLVTHWAAFDAAAPGGNMIIHAELTAPKTINASDSVAFDAGALTVNIG